MQIKKLPDWIARRQAVGEAVRKSLSGSEIVHVGEQVPETDGVYWFLRIFVDADRLKVDKARFCEAVAAEGIPVNPSYRHIPAEAPWYRNTPGARVSDMPGAVRAAESHFNIHYHERFGDREAKDIITALQKVEHAYAI